MDQLYEAMLIPSSGDDEDTLEAARLDVSSHSSGASSSSRRCTHSADETSPVASDADGEAPGGDADGFGRDLYAAQHGQRQGHGRHQEVFTTSSSPHALCTFLVELLRVAEDLHSRLERLLAEKVASVSTAAPYSQTSPPENDSRGCQAISGRARASRQRPASSAYKGIAKLRSRLCKETANVRRAVEGLSAAGCTPMPTSLTSPDSLVVPPAIFEAAVACAQCNSLSHYDGIITCLERERDITGVYVPVSGYVGLPQYVPSASVNGSKTAHRLSFREGMRFEVDVVSSSEHRWIKVKTATARNLELEAEALDLNGATPFTDMLLALLERAKRTCLPHRRAVQVAVVLLHPPPPALEKFFAAHGIVWASLSADRSVQVPRRRIRAHGPQVAPTRPATTWLPPLAPSPAVICLDTTALVTLCSQSCYEDGLPHSLRMERLAPFRVLREQQRKEVVECRAVVEVLEPALRSLTAWYTRDALEMMMRQALLLQCDNAAVDAAPSAAFKQPGQAIPAALIVPTELDWLGPLEAAARERCADSADENAHEGTVTATTTAAAPSATVPLDESSLLVEYSGLAERAATSALPSLHQKPNWVMADITYEEFKWILETIAGPREVARAARLLRLVSVVDTTFLRHHMCSGGGYEGGHGAPSVTGRDTAAPPACPWPPTPPIFTSVEYLRLSGKVSLRNKIVFGLADAVNAVIVTANEQVSHAAREQGVHVEACFHPSRSLTEQKVYRLRRRDGPRKPPGVTL
ncbi:conserved hypothetical protein [Leishmania mexicana MHOM/GT/2001/U1103]|uniref:DUF1308 domain-containing protein n=1 Tax=Leishmania mexicana (strain MHOM/GT/2001/U1103) TaxID=929439 RepID=E9AXB2_LEIMU|nr:conserved hypothetical protein [Leishmania mexicana MHOM/GT/2001/U1103]CBZ27603.1 conserved hypothetical protein [Leishmania mexicana MHOM/GT/2001/U1103]